MSLKAYVIVGHVPTFSLVERCADESSDRLLPGHYGTVFEASIAREWLVGQNDAEDHAVREREQGVNHGLVNVANYYR